MADEGIVERTETTGKGGGRRIFRMKYDEADFKEYVAVVINRSLLRDFPEETRNVLKTFSSSRAIIPLFFQ